MQAWDFENGIEQRGGDTGENAQTGHVSGVKGELDIEALESCGAVDERPVDVDSNASNSSEGLAVGRAKGVKCSGGDFGGAVTAIESAVEEEADFGDKKGACYDERAEEVVNGVGLESED